MPRLSARRIQGLIGSGRSAQTSPARGRALEDLICYIFGEIPGVRVTSRNALSLSGSEEIDVALWNDQEPRGFNFLPNIILVECKNWAAPVASNEVTGFDSKIRTRGLSHGVLVAANGITGDAQEHTRAQEVLLQALGDGRRMIVITGDEILAFRNTDHVVQIFKQKLCDLVVYGGLPL